MERAQAIFDPDGARPFGLAPVGSSLPGIPAHRAEAQTLKEFAMSTNTSVSQIADLETPLKFAYWVPNVSGGLVVSTIEQRTSWDFDYNKKLARIAENSGFEYALTQTRYAASYGADKQHEATSFSLALLGATEKLKVISAVHPGMWHPGVLAKFIITADHLSGGRAAVNIVSGWLKDEFVNFGLEWLEHDERYVRTEEFIRVLRGLWTEQNYSQSGKYYNIKDFTLNPAPLDVPGRAHPEIFFGGNSTAAQAAAGRTADWYFSNGKDLAGFQDNISGVTAAAAAVGRTPKFGLNGFVIARDTEVEAKDTLREIVEKAHRPAVEGFRAAVQEAGASTKDGKGMWADSSYEDLVQYNDGFKTGLIGTPEQIAQRIVDFKKIGVNLMLTCYLHFQEEVEAFGRNVLPIVRELEADLARKNGTELNTDLLPETNFEGATV
jgi:FMNH2-dependent dimethyl sulfone monooxygenase